MKKLMILLAALFVAFAGPALADGPSGSTEMKDCPATGTASSTDDNGCVYDEDGNLADPDQQYDSNDVSCGDGVAADDNTTVYVGTNGAEVCRDSGDLQGRIYADSNGAAADGDNDNEGMDERLTGFARVDGNGISCGSGDSSNGAASSPDECG